MNEKQRKRLLEKYPQLHGRDRVDLYSLHLNPGVPGVYRFALYSMHPATGPDEYTPSPLHLLHPPDAEGSGDETKATLLPHMVNSHSSEHRQDVHDQIRYYDAGAGFRIQRDLRRCRGEATPELPKFHFCLIGGGEDMEHRLIYDLASQLRVWLRCFPVHGYKITPRHEVNALPHQEN